MGRVAPGVRPSWALSVALLLAAACKQDSAIQTSIVPLASGQFYGVNWGGTQEDRFFVVARPGTPDTRTASATLVSPNHKQPCDLGDDVWTYGLLQPRLSSEYVIGSPSPANVLLFRQLDEQRYGTLSFADVNCKRSDLEISDVTPGARWYLFSPDLTQMTIALIKRDQTLIYVDPWSQEQQEVAHDVTSAWQYDQNLALLEGGQLVQRDRDGKQLSRRGSNIQEYTGVGSRGDYADIEDAGVFVVRDGTVKNIGPADAAGCDPKLQMLTAADAFMPGSLGFFSPCATRRLVVAGGSSSKTYTYEENVDYFGFDAGVLLFTTQTDSTTKLWLATSSEADHASMIAERDSFGLATFFSIRPGLLMLIATPAANPGTSTVWVLDLADPTHTLTTLTENVAHYRIADSASALQYQDGHLDVLDGDFTTLLLRIPSPVTGWDFVFNGKATGFAYISNVDPMTQLGRLELHLVNGQHFVIAEDVREWKEVGWPERGLVYATGGEHPGINFARVDIPCEATSDTAWACGF